MPSICQQENYAIQLIQWGQRLQGSGQCELQQGSQDINQARQLFMQAQSPDQAQQAYALWQQGNYEINDGQSRIQAARQYINQAQSILSSLDYGCTPC